MATLILAAPLAARLAGASGASWWWSPACWVVAAMLALLGIGMGLVVAPATESIMGAVPLAKAGVGSATNDTTRQR